jgi:protease I|tara:strand:- start:942 stop:1475 length:534 start_codon:yes stop_codon:yes gene_type:complete
MNLMKALIITWENFQDQEVVYPYYRLKEETDDVKIISNVTGRFHGIMGVNMTSHDTLDNLTNYSNYDFLVLPGGVKSLEKLRQEKDVLEFIRQWDVDGKLIASTCHGAQLMISAKITEGRKISGYYSIKDDINNSGAIYVDAPSVSDGNIVSSPHYDHMGAWMKEAITLYYANAERG